MSNHQQYVQQVNSLSLNTIKSIFETAAVLVEAKQSLSKDDYHEFLNYSYSQRNTNLSLLLELLKTLPLIFNQITSEKTK
jgi:hypothetical protein